MKANRSSWLKNIGLTLVMIFMLVSCNFPLSSGASNDYFGGIAAGSYCVSVAGNPPGGFVPVGGSSQDISLGSGDSAGANVPFWINLY